MILPPAPCCACCTADPAPAMHHAGVSWQHSVPCCSSREAASRAPHPSLPQCMAAGYDRLATATPHAATGGHQQGGACTSCPRHSCSHLQQMVRGGGAMRSAVTCAARAVPSRRASIRQAVTPPQRRATGHSTSKAGKCALQSRSCARSCTLRPAACPAPAAVLRKDASDAFRWRESSAYNGLSREEGPAAVDAVDTVDTCAQGSQSDQQYPQSGTQAPCRALLGPQSVGGWCRCLEQSGRSLPELLLPLQRTGNARGGATPARAPRMDTARRCMRRSSDAVLHHNHDAGSIGRDGRGGMGRPPLGCL
jgi:hypothetical protein